MSILSNPDPRSPLRDYRDLVIEVLVASEAELLERVASLEGDVVRYRELLQLALAALHDLSVKQEAARARHLRLLDEYRQLRERLTQEAVAA
ncbi:MAG: hypothetical protein WBD07_18240 [Vicinamibacterales bacterium]